VRLINRLEKLEDTFKIMFPPEVEKPLREYVKEWMEKDPQAMPLFKQFEDYCRKSGVPYHLKTRWVELTRSDPVAADLGKKWLDSYKDYIFANYGVVPK
jgi:phage regulator Rha-like protein